MKINRRKFITGVTSLGVGAAAGTVLSPSPWKITDDLSIWTQNWSNKFIRTPVPADGEANYVNSTCTLCPGGCGITVRKIDNRAVKIEGADGHPVNDGGICLLGISGLQLLYGKSRIKTPLIKSGNSWKKISWDVAVREVVDKLQQLRGNNESTKLACISGSDRGTVPHLLGRFMTAFGSPNFFRVPNYQDVYEMTLKQTQGKHAYPGFDLENSDYILSFGCGLVDGWGSPVRMFRANAKWKTSNSTIIQIEPRMSNTAAKADKWVPIKPGTEADLALGLAWIIVEKNLFSRDFIDSYADGIDEFKAALKEYNPDMVSKKTGVAATKMEEIAKSFARAASPIALFGKGQGHTPGSMRESMAIHALNALVGNINRKGGIWSMPEIDYIEWPEPKMDEIAQKGMSSERLDGAGHGKLDDTRYILNRLPSKKDGIKVLFVSGANPCYTMPDAKSFQKAIEDIPFVVSFSSYMDETTQKADLILPNHSYLERYEDLPFASGLQKPIINLSQPVVEPQYKTQHTGDVVIRIAKEMGGSLAASFEWENYEACLEETMGDKWETLTETGFWVDEAFNKKSWGEGFETASGKFSFGAIARSLKEKPSSDGNELLLIPFDTIRIAGGFIGTPPFALKTVPDTVLKDKTYVCVEINPQTAQGIPGIRDGKLAKLQTSNHEAVKVKVNFSEGIIPGIIAIPRGLGHEANNPDYDNFLAGKGLNFNELIRPVEDASTGLDVAYAVPATLKKA